MAYKLSADTLKRLKEKQEKEADPRYRPVSSAQRDVFETQQLRAIKAGAEPIERYTGLTATEEAQRKLELKAGEEELRFRTEPALIEGAKRAAELKKPTRQELTPMDTPLQKKVEEAIPFFGPGAAAIGTAFTERERTGGEYAGVLVEGTPVLSWAVNLIKAGNLLNTPGSSAKTLATQIPNVRTDITQLVRRTSNPAEVIIGLSDKENELTELENQIKSNIAVSAELRANPEDVDKIESEIYQVRNLIYYYRREILSDPNKLIVLQNQISLIEG